MAPIAKPTAAVVNPVKDVLVRTYGKDNVVYDGGWVLKVLGPVGRPERKAILATINKLFKGSVYVKGSGDATGEVTFKGLSIVAKKAMGATGGKSRSSLKPKDIVPAIVNVWISSNQMVKNVLTYLKNSNFDKDFRLKVEKLLTDTENSKAVLTVPYDDIGDPIPPEFFEVLTALKLSVALEQNDQRLRQVLGIPKGVDLRKSKIKIMIPLAANAPLLDYEINITSSENKTDKEPSLKISVKSKLAGSVVNTVKFSDAFDTAKEVEVWYKEHKSAKENQKGPFETAHSALKSKEIRKTVLYPLVTVGNLINEQSMEQVIRARYLPKGVTSIKFLKDALEQTKKKFTNIVPATSLVDPAVGLKDVNTLISFIKLALRTEAAVNPVFGNFSVACEKILVDAAKQDSVTKYNFYQMFYDMVLCEKSIAYAVATKQGKTVVYSFYSSINYAQEYKNWVGLRAKNSANDFGKGTLGMDV